MSERASNSPISYPFFLYIEDNFTNRKHRHLTLQEPIGTDADWILTQVSLISDKRLQNRFSMLLYGPGDMPLSSGFISARLYENSDRVPVPIFPDVRYPSRTEVHIDLKLDDGFSVGKTRPWVKLLLSGRKEIQQPKLQERTT